MKIRYTLNVDDDARRAIAEHYGEGERPASRQTVALWLDILVTATIEDLVSEYRRHRHRAEAAEAESERRVDG